MTDRRTLVNIIRSSCIGASLVLAAAVHGQDGLADYDEDLSMYGYPRPAGPGNPQRLSELVSVADVDETVLDRRVTRDIVRDHRHRVVDRLGDYMEDFSTYDVADDVAVDTARPSHTDLAQRGLGEPLTLGREPDRDIEVIITIRADDRGKREITRYVTRLGGDMEHTVTISAGDVFERR